MQEDFTGFVLAGGKSSRMGAEKLALELNGESFLERAANVLRTSCKEVKLVLNEHQTVETEYEIVRDIFKERGALGGMHTAFINCATKFAVILAVDLPFVTAEAIENLTKIALSSNKFLAYVPRQNDGKLQPVCAVYRANYCLPALEKLLEENDSASIRAFLEQIFPKYIEAEKLSENENLFFNVNFPSDAEEMLKKS